MRMRITYSSCKLLILFVRKLTKACKVNRIAINYWQISLELAYPYCSVTLSLTLSACARVTVLILFVCVCVSLTTLEATLIYSAKNEHQWTANGILFILKKLKSCKLAPLIQKQLSKLTAALYRTSNGHAHLLKFKVHFKGYFLSVGIECS